MRGAAEVRFDDGTHEKPVPLEEVRWPAALPEPDPGPVRQPRPEPEPEPEPQPGPGPESDPKPPDDVPDVARQQREQRLHDLSARTRELLADGKLLACRVSSALAAMRSETIGSSADLEDTWQHYRSQHDVMGDRLLSFGASFPPGTWEAATETAGGVMADMMNFVELPDPTVPIAPGNTSQLLSETLRAEKGAVQRAYREPVDGRNRACSCGVRECTVWTDGATPAGSDAWCMHLELLSEQKDPPLALLLEEFIVSQGDPRLGLIGQRAVRVRPPEPELDSDGGFAKVCNTIPVGSVLLHYAGSVRTQSEFDEVYDVHQRLL
jgi:hypothetical protein